MNTWIFYTDFGSGQAWTILIFSSSIQITWLDTT